MPLTIQTKNKSNKGGKEPFAKETLMLHTYYQ